MDAVVAGLVLGLGSGFSPGPLLALAIAVTLRRGTRSGLAVAAAPLVSDALIIVLALTVVSQLPPVAVAALSLVGAVVITGFAVETARAARRVSVADLARAPEVRSGWRGAVRSPLLQGALVNILNPAPWLFWITAGAPLLIGYWDTGPILAAGFLLAMYAGLLGGKVAVVAGVAVGRHRLDDRAYRLILLVTAVALLAVAVLLLVSGIRGLG